MQNIKEKKKVKNMKKNIYRIKQTELREQAIDWQMNDEQMNYSYAELAEWYDYFYTQGKRLGLLREFRTEGIL